MAACRGYFEGAFHRFLSTNLGHVYGIAGASSEERLGVHSQWLDGNFAPQKLSGLLKASNGDDI